MKGSGQVAGHEGPAGIGGIGEIGYVPQIRHTMCFLQNKKDSTDLKEPKTLQELEHLPIL